MTLPPRTRPSWRHRLFQVGVVLKGVDGILEVVGGVLLGAFGSAGLSRAVTFLTQHELSEDPHDLVAGWLVRHTRGLGVETVHFAVAYLLVHGAVKVVLAAGLMRERLRAFPAALGFLGLFVLYQAYRVIITGSAGLALLTATDVVIIWLVWQEYRVLRRVD